MEESVQRQSTIADGFKTLLQILLLAPILFFMFSFFSTFELEQYSIGWRIAYGALLLVTYLAIWVLSTNKFTRFLVFMLGLYLVWLVLVQITAPSFKSLGFDAAQNMSAITYIPQPVISLYQDVYRWFVNFI